MEARAVSFAGALFVGALLGWLAHLLAQSRSRHDRTVADERAKIDNAMLVFSEEIRYVIARRRGRPGWQKMKEDFRDLQRRHWDARPETIVTAEQWATYMTAERASADRQVPIETRIRALEDARTVVLDALTARQAKLRSQRW